ncbi:hypothetical protein ACB098_06G182700 [Castanea mollissima]
MLNIALFLSLLLSYFLKGPTKRKTCQTIPLLAIQSSYCNILQIPHTNNEEDDNDNL